MLDRQKIRNEISNAARERWNQLNEVGMQGLVAGECADIAVRVLDAHGAFERPQDERDARIAQLERELRDLRGTELNPSPLMLDAQAYGELRDEIAATMGDEWDLDEAEISILIKYVRWLAAGQPRDEDGYPIRHKTPEGLGGASEASRCRNSEATTQPQDDGDVRVVAAITAERDEARELARVSLDILRNVSDEPMRELYGVDDFDEMPGWFTGYGKPGGKR